MTNIHVILLAYVLDFRPMLSSFMSDDVMLHMFVHSRHPGIAEACRETYKKYPRVIWYDYGINRGCGKSINEGIQASLNAQADVILVPNDDLIMERCDFDVMVKACRDHPEAGLITCNGYDVDAGKTLDLDFCFFGINRVAIEKVGFFDQNIFPAYYDDRDYLRRLHLLDVPIHNIGDTGVVHQRSATLSAVPALREQLQVTFPRNQMYYVQKHLGDLGHEQAEHPFNDPDLSWRIPYEERGNPYPAHQRHDQDIVKV